MKNKNSLILLVLFILMIFAGAVSAQDRPPEGDRMPPPGMPGGPGHRDSRARMTTGAKFCGN